MQHRPIHVAHPQAVDSQPFSACSFHLSGCLMFTKIVNVFIDAEMLLFGFCAAEAGCLNCTWLSKYY